MTNTGDFRRYSYSSDTSYAIDAFNLSRSSAAPAYTPEPKKELKVRENGKRKSKNQLLQEQRIGFGRTVTIITAAVLVLAMFFGVLYTYAIKNELNYEISRLETQLAVAQSENTRINSELNALVSVSMIDKYAVEELGMSKMQSYQISYIDVSQYKEEHKNAIEYVAEQAAKK
ncbi:MAG: septum formation initiator family protein [Eubacterium sp.]|nr:septum formation initiator family protein [Eubacterium sp.]